MTERIADPQAVCPFVALDEDRDFRSPVPDHRHRCFAESPAAPRALAHQAAYCLSSAFPGCPTFVDWARREAAPARSEAQARSLREHADTPRAVPPPVPSKRAEPDWTAPPPWGVAAGAAAAAAGPGAGPGAGREPAGFDAEAADAAGTTPSSSATPPAEAQPGWPADAAAAPSFLAGRSRPAGQPTAWQDDEAPAQVAPGAPVAPAVPAEPLEDQRYAPSSRQAPVEERRVPVGYAPVAPSKDRRAGAPGADRRDPAAPSWEQPRRLEAYPTLKSRGAGGLPRPALYALIVLLVGVGLFAAPFILQGLGGSGETDGSPTPATSESAEPTVEPSPTPEPTPEKVVYVVKSGDTLSRIAKKYGVTVGQILEANPSIKNANNINVGDEIVIPQPLPSEITNEEITEAP